MKVGLVYRGYTYDLFSQPRYAGTVSAGTRIGRIPFSTPDVSQPDDKVISDKGHNIKLPRPEQPTTHSLGAWRFNRPQFTDVAQEIMVAEKLKQAGKDLNREDALAGKDAQTEAQVVTALDKDLEAQDRGLFSRYHQNLAGEQSIGLDDQRFQGPGRSGTAGDSDRTQSDHGDSRKKSTKVSSEEDLYHRSNWDFKDYADNKMEVNTLSLNLEKPDVRLGLNRRAALLALEYAHTAQNIMAAEKVKAGREALALEAAPVRLDNEFGRGAGVQDNRDGPDSSLQGLSPGESKTKAGSSISVFDSIGIISTSSRTEAYSMEGTRTVTSSSSTEVNISRTDFAAYGREQVSVDHRTLKKPVEIGYYKVPENLIVLEPDIGAPIIEIKTPDGKPFISREAIRVGLENRSDYFDRDLLVSPRPLRREEMFGLNYHGPQYITRKRGVTSVSDMKAPVGTEFRSFYTVSLNPINLGVDNTYNYLGEAPPVILYTKPRTLISSRQPVELEHRREKQGLALRNIEYRSYSEALPLDRMYHRPEFPSQVEVDVYRSDQPFDNRSHFRTVKENVPVPPIHSDTLELHRKEVNNIHKDVDNIRRQVIEENQLYGRDNPNIQEVVHLIEQRELDKFDLKVVYLEGQHTPPIDKGREDRLPENIMSLSLESLVYGWSHKG